MNVEPQTTQSSMTPHGMQAQAQPRTRITAKGVRKLFGSLEVFHDINLEVGEREVLAIIGPSSGRKRQIVAALSTASAAEK